MHGYLVKFTNNPTLTETQSQQVTFPAFQLTSNPTTIFDDNQNDTQGKTWVVYIVSSVSGIRRLMMGGWFKGTHLVVRRFGFTVFPLFTVCFRNFIIFYDYYFLS